MKFDLLNPAESQERRYANMITRADKDVQVKGLVEQFAKAKAAFVVDFKGLRVEQVTDLRKKLHPTESEMKVVRNTLCRLALKSYPEMDKVLSDKLKGTNAIVFAYGDVTASAKTLATYAKDVEVFQLKMGVMDGQLLGEVKIKYLSTLPSKDVLRAQFLGVLNAPATKFVRTLSAVPSGFARVLQAHHDKTAGA
jgi:large subunit ribosomal protein L10